MHRNLTGDQREVTNFTSNSCYAVLPVLLSPLAANEALLKLRPMLRATCLPLLCLALLGYHTSVCPAADGLTLGGIGLTPNSRVVPGRVMVLLAKVVNRSDKPAVGTIVMTIDELSNLQSTRTVALEPGESDQFELFFPLPTELTQFERIHLAATLAVRQGDHEVILERNGTPAISTLTLPVTTGDVFGIAAEPDQPTLPYWYWPPLAPPTGYELATAARLDAGGKRVSASFENRSLPLNRVQWSGIDLFIIAEPSVLVDPAGVESMQQFMADGGRIWVMLDKVPSRLIRPLLAPDQSCEEVERVVLNELTIDVDLGANSLSEADRTLRSDAGMPMTRVLQSGGRVTHRAGQWPVSLTMDIGYGQLLLTTLDSSVWIEPRSEKNRSSDPLLSSDFQTRLWNRSFAIDANAPRAELPVSESIDYPLQLIGNPVVPKSWVAIALLGFCLVLAAMGLGFAYLGRLTAMGVLAPAVALVASLALLLAATWVRRDIPESVSRLQFIEVGDDGDFALVREQASVYLSAAENMQLDSQVDGMMRSSSAVTTGVRRLVVNDFQKWQMANTDWPPGAWRYDAEFSIPTADLIVDGRLSDQGLELSLPGPLPAPFQDAVLSFVAGDPLLCRPTSAGLRVDNQLTPAAGSWISGSLISDEQQRRLEVYQRYFEPNPLLQRPARRLLGWTTPWQGASWNRELQQQGSALVALPVRLQRPDIGQEVFVPHGLVQLRKDNSRGNITSIFNDRTGKWRTEISIPGRADIQFVLPAEVVPLSASAIDFNLDIAAPQRVVTITIATEMGPVELVKLDSPSIAWSHTVADPAILQAFQDGILNVNIEVGELKSVQNAQALTSVVTWHIDHFHASVRGRVLASSSLSEKR